MEMGKETVNQTVTVPVDYIVEKITAGVSSEFLPQEIGRRMTAAQATEISATHWTYCPGRGGLAAPRRIPALLDMATVIKTATVRMDSNVVTTIARNSFHMLETSMTVVKPKLSQD